MKVSQINTAKLGILLLLFAVFAFAFTACGLKGRAYLKQADGTVGPNIAGVNITFTTDNGSYIRTTKTDDSGNYKRDLKWSIFSIQASHLAYSRYDSSPTTYTVPWLGYKHVNIPLTPYNGTVVIVVRHAEKEATSGNVNLIADDGTGIGLGRADKLATIAASSRIVAAYSTNYCRTTQTAQPSALQASLTMHILNSGPGFSGCQPSITANYELLPNEYLDYNNLRDHILSHYTNRAVLIVGHSNTVPNIVMALTNTSTCPIQNALNQCGIPEDEFHHMFVVYFPSSGTPSYEHLTYGLIGP